MTTPKLNRPADWPTWFQVAQFTADVNEIWDLISPDIADSEVSKLTAPTPPDETVALNAQGQFTEFGKFQYQNRLELYKEEQRIVESRKAAVARFNDWLNTTVATHFITLYRPQVRIPTNESTPNVPAAKVRGLLKLFKARLSPTEDDRCYEVTQRYNSLQRKPSFMSIESWIDAWVRVVEELDTLNIYQRVQGDFLRANAEIDRAYAAAWRRDVEKGDYSFHETANAFQSYYRTMFTQERGQEVQSSFSTPTLGGQTVTVPVRLVGLYPASVLIDT